MEGVQPPSYTMGSIPLNSNDKYTLADTKSHTYLFMTKFRHRKSPLFRGGFFQFKKGS